MTVSSALGYVLVAVLGTGLFTVLVVIGAGILRRTKMPDTELARRLLELEARQAALRTEWSAAQDSLEDLAETAERRRRRARAVEARAAGADEQPTAIPTRAEMLARIRARAKGGQ